MKDIYYKAGTELTVRGKKPYAKPMPVLEATREDVKPKAEVDVSAALQKFRNGEQLDEAELFGLLKKALNQERARKKAEKEEKAKKERREAAPEQEDKKKKQEQIQPQSVVSQLEKQAVVKGKDPKVVERQVQALEQLPEDVGFVPEELRVSQIQQDMLRTAWKQHVEHLSPELKTRYDIDTLVEIGARPLQQLEVHVQTNEQALQGTSVMQIAEQVTENGTQNKTAATYLEQAKQTDEKTEEKKTPLSDLRKLQQLRESVQEGELGGPHDGKIEAENTLIDTVVADVGREQQVSKGIVAKPIPIESETFTQKPANALEYLSYEKESQESKSRREAVLEERRKLKAMIPIHEKIANKTERVIAAQKLLERDLTPKQQDALQFAHEIGQGQIGKDGEHIAAIGNYTKEMLVMKAKELRTAGFSVKEINKILRSGLAGDEPTEEVVPTPTPSDAVPEKQKGEKFSDFMNRLTPAQQEKYMADNRQTFDTPDSMLAAAMEKSRQAEQILASNESGHHEFFESNKNPEDRRRILRQRHVDERYINNRGEIPDPPRNLTTMLEAIMRMDPRFASKQFAQKEAAEGRPLTDSKGRRIIKDGDMPLMDEHGKVIEGNFLKWVFITLRARHDDDPDNPNLNFFNSIQVLYPTIYGQEGQLPIAVLMQSDAFWTESKEAGGVAHTGLREQMINLAWLVASIRNGWIYDNNGFLDESKWAENRINIWGSNAMSKIGVDGKHTFEWIMGMAADWMNTGQKEMKMGDVINETSWIRAHMADVDFLRKEYEKTGLLTGEAFFKALEDVSKVENGNKVTIPPDLYEVAKQQYRQSAEFIRLRDSRFAERERVLKAIYSKDLDEMSIREDYTPEKIQEIINRLGRQLREEHIPDEEIITRLETERRRLGEELTQKLQRAQAELNHEREVISDELVDSFVNNLPQVRDFLMNKYLERAELIKPKLRHPDDGHGDHDGHGHHYREEPYSYVTRSGTPTSWQDLMDKWYGYIPGKDTKATNAVRRYARRHRLSINSKGQVVNAAIGSEQHVIDAAPVVYEQRHDLRKAAEGEFRTFFNLYKTVQKNYEQGRLATRLIKDVAGSSDLADLNNRDVVDLADLIAEWLAFPMGSAARNDVDLEATNVQTKRTYTLLYKRKMATRSRASRRGNDYTMNTLVGTPDTWTGITTVNKKVLYEVFKERHDAILTSAEKRRNLRTELDQRLFEPIMNMVAEVDDNGNPTATLRQKVRRENTDILPGQPEYNDYIDQKEYEAYEEARKDLFRLAKQDEQGAQVLAAVLGPGTDRSWIDQVLTEDPNIVGKQEVNQQLQFTNQQFRHYANANLKNAEAIYNYSMNPAEQDLHTLFHHDMIGRSIIDHGKMAEKVQTLITQARYSWYTWPIKMSAEYRRMTNGGEGRKLEFETVTQAEGIFGPQVLLLTQELWHHDPVVHENEHNHSNELYGLGHVKFVDAKGKIRRDEHGNIPEDVKRVLESSQFAKVATRAFLLANWGGQIYAVSKFWNTYKKLSFHDREGVLHGLAHIPATMHADGEAMTDLKKIKVNENYLSHHEIEILRRISGNRFAVSFGLDTLKEAGIGLWDGFTKALGAFFKALRPA